jgi:AcrR family transcriptional regulator
MGNMSGDDMTAAGGEALRSPAAPGVPMRERIVEAAAELFYAQGLRAVSAEKVIAQVGITKVTSYRHFPTKDDLIVAHLERRARWERDAIGQARQAADDVPDALRNAASAVVAFSNQAAAEQTSTSPP